MERIGTVEVEEHGLLSGITFPEDLRRLDVAQLAEVCDELRRDIVRELSVNPGHLASSLGAVELTVALHYVYDTPEDRIVWDVGHQAYGHKILTGRRELFSTNRKLGGLRPFPSPLESEYDSFVCGHASNSISAALGMAIAAKKTGNGGRKVVAVIGDGAMSGGLAFEGLNNAASSPNDLLIVLNDNDMSIDRAVGGMRQYLLNLNTNKTYNAIKFRTNRWLHRKGLLNDDRRNGLQRLSNAIKSVIARQQNVFEGMNIRYFGPFDGHNVEELVRILRQLRDLEGPKLLHVHTKKGHGYGPAERDVTTWHAPGRFDPETGERIVDRDPTKPQKYQDVFGHTLLELAEQNPRIVGVTPAMPTGCSMNIMMEKMACRTFDVGIAEGHAVTFSAGMAKDGLLPFCNIYSAFAQRAYDNIIHDVAILDLPVVLCLDRAGLVGEDGATHHGAFDLAMLRPIPNLTICSPMDEHELRRLMFTAQTPGKGAFVIRYPRGGGVLQNWRCPLEEVAVGTGRRLREGSDVAVLSIGPIGNDVAEAIEELCGPQGAATRWRHSGTDEQTPSVVPSEEPPSVVPSEEPPSVVHSEQPLSVAHYDMRFLKPIDEGILEEVGRKFDRIVTVENGVRNGGLGSAVLEWMNDHGYHPQVTRLGLPDTEFVEHGTVAELQHLVGLDKAAIKAGIMKGCAERGNDKD